MKDYAYPLLVGVIIIIGIAFFVWQGFLAAECAEAGGDYVKNWLGWPECVGIE